MRRRHITIAVASLAVLGSGVAAGCGSQGVASPTPQTVVGTVSQPTTPNTKTGNPANGKAVFASNGCASCHTFTPAGAKGTVGPNLDNLADYAKKAGQPIADFAKSAITSPPPSYVPPGFPKNVMPTTFGQTIKPQDLADLVAFLTKSS